MKLPDWWMIIIAGNLFGNRQLQRDSQAPAYQLYFADSMELTMHRKLHFLIIDDSQPTLEVYTQLLQKAGHQVTAYTSCDNALENITKLKPDCVLCDLILPGMDGIDLFKLLRSEKQIKQPVFIIISAKHYDYDRRQAMLLGIDGYLTKPINQSSFLTDILAIIERPKS